MEIEFQGKYVGAPIAAVSDHVIIRGKLRDSVTQSLRDVSIQLDEAATGEIKIMVFSDIEKIHLSFILPPERSSFIVDDHDQIEKEKLG